MLASRAFDLVDKVRTTMKYPNSIPLWHASGELFPGNALCQVVLSSAGTKWNDVVLELHDFLSKRVFGMPPKTFLSCGESSFLSKNRTKLQENHNILQ